MDLVLEAERLGFDSVWTSEAYGSDAITPATWILSQTSKIHVGTCIMQIPARTPANAAMTAMTLSDLSDGRFIVGLGASGPQVVEGWHGISYKKPVTRTREYIEIMRKIMAREEPVTYDGGVYQLPLKDNAIGLGKPLKSIMAANNDIPIYTASITPAGLAAAAEVADGVFPVFQTPDNFDALGPHLEKGFAKTNGAKSLENFEIVPNVMTIMADDVKACMEPLKQWLGLYIGGMGAKNKNFYVNYVTAMGYGEEALKIQDLYLSGDKEGAAALVPEELIDEIALVGSEARIRERAERWKVAGEKRWVSHLMFSAQQPELLPVLANIFKN